MNRSAYAQGEARVKGQGLLPTNREGLQQQVIPLINPLPTSIPATPQQPRRSTRNRAQPEIFGRDYGLFSHIDSYVQQDTLAFCYKSIVEISDECPITLREAMSGAESEQWKRAIQREVDSLQSHNVWENDPVEFNEQMSVVKTRFLFKKKDGNSEKEIFKARLVAQGYSQIEGIDYEETFSGVIDKVSIRLVFHIIASMKMKCFKFDVSTAFMNAKLPEDNIFVTLPCEIFPNGIGKVFKLRRALYGLKQSPRAWQSELAATLFSMGFRAVEKDPCVYVLIIESELRAICGIHVDDGLVGAIETELLNQIVRLLTAVYKITISPEPKIYLAIEAQWIRAENLVVLRQTTYIEKMARKFEIDLQHDVKIPMDQNKQLTKS